MVYLAPHHDDVLLSRPAALLAQGGSEAHVIVCFSNESPALEAQCTRLHQELGVIVHLLGLPEAVRRGTSLRSCLQPTRSLEAVQTDLMMNTLRRALKKCLRELGTSKVCAPLLPIHLDHALVRCAAECMGNLDLSYYEDQPYAVLFPSCRQRETGQMCPIQENTRASADNVERLLRQLEAFVSSRDIARLSQRYLSMPVPEPLWRADATQIRSLP